MARPLRLNFAGGLYYVTARGNDQKTIVRADSDRQEFMAVLAKMIEQYRVICHAWVLMDNHYHLFLETPAPNLSAALRHLNGVYTQAFNRRYRRVGHLFQGRYKAIVVEKDAYFLELCRYIVLNPVRAGMVTHPRDYPWSSYRATAGQCRIPHWLTVEEILERLAPSTRDAEVAYRKFIRDGIKSRESPWERVVAQLYLGSERFITRIQKQFQRDHDREIPHRQRMPIWVSETEVLRRVAREYGIPIRECVQATRRPSEARQVALYGLRRQAGLGLTAIAQKMGLGYTAVSRHVGRVDQRLENDSRFRKKVEQIFHGRRHS